MLAHADPAMDLVVGKVWMESRGLKGSFDPRIDFHHASLESRLLDLAGFVARNPMRLKAPSVELADVPFCESIQTKSD